MSNPSTQFRTAIPALTSIRFFAALAVMMFHYGAGFLARLGLPGPIVQFFENGFLGVSLFFVLSGFIITYSHKSESISRRFLADFYVARIARIYPVYLLSLLIMLPVVLAPFTPLSGVSVLAMVQSWTPIQSGRGYTWMMQAWTLSIEAFFYLLFPLLWIGLRRVSSAVNIALIVLSALALVMFGLPSVVPGTVQLPFLPVTGWILLPVYRLPEFIYGMTLCRLLMDHPDLSRRLGGSATEIALVVAMAAVLMFATDVHSKAVFTVLAGLLLLVVFEGHGIVTRLLSVRLLLLLGGASYAMYLLQAPVRHWCARLIPVPLDQFISPFATVALSIVVFLLFEQTMRRAILRAWRGYRQPPEDVRRPTQPIKRGSAE